MNTADHASPLGSVVAAAREHLDAARGPQHDRVLVLRRVRAGQVDERRVGADDAGVAERLQRARVALLARAERVTGSEPSACGTRRRARARERRRCVVVRRFDAAEVR